MRRFALFLIFISSVASAQIANHKLGEVTGKGTEGTYVAISPRNNKNVVVYAAGKLQHSNDAGATWKESPLAFPAGMEGTPIVSVDGKGNFFIVYSAGGQITTHVSSNDGKSWDEPVVILPTPGKYQYNPGVGTHPKKDDIVVSWTESDKFGSSEAGCKSNIMMSTSSSGKKWSKPIQVNQISGGCMDDNVTTRGSKPLIAVDDKRFVLWTNDSRIFLDRSYDGSMWISTDLAITQQIGGWASTIPGFGKIANTPAVTIDTSPSRIQGTLFVAFSDTTTAKNDNDIWLVRSVNRGDSWTSPARVNQDKPGRDQFLPRISIDQANGAVYILYYDRRDLEGNQTDVYLSWSVDGGSQFKEKKITEKPFVADLDQNNAMTNYISLSANKGIIIPVWTVINGGKQEVWSAVLKFEDLK